MTVFSPSVPLEALSHPSFGKVELFELANCSGPVEVIYMSVWDQLKYI